MSVSWKELERVKDLSWEEIAKELKKRENLQPEPATATSSQGWSADDITKLSWEEIQQELQRRDQELSQAVREAPQLAVATYEDIEKQLDQKAQQGKQSPWDFIKYGLASGIFRTAKDLNNAIRLAYEGSARFVDYMTNLVDKNLYSPEKDKVLNYLNSLVEATEKTEEKLTEKGRTQSWIKEFIREGLAATPEVLTAMFLGTGVPGATGSIAKMLPFWALATGAHARSVEKEFEAVGKEAPYWKRLVGGLLGGTGEVATEMPVYAGISKLLKSAGILNAVNRGAEKLLNTFGEKAVEFTKDVLLEAAQEAEMEPIERAIKQTLGLPQDWSIASIAKDMADAAKGGLAMALIVGGIGAGAISLERLSQTRNVEQSIVTEEAKEEAEEKPEVRPEEPQPETEKPPQPETPEIPEAPQPEIPQPEIPQPEAPETEAAPEAQPETPEIEEAQPQPKSALEIERWQKLVEEDPARVEELKNYINELAYGREAGEPIKDYFERINLGEFYDWAQQTIEDYERMQAVAKQVEEAVKAEPWQLTFDEYKERINPEVTVEEWEAMIDEAIREGKDVPWEVIASNPKIYQMPGEMEAAEAETEEAGVFEEAIEAEKAITEAEEEIAQTKEQQWKKLRKAILELGGINDADYEDIPFYLKRKTGHTLDDIVDELREVYGFPVYTANDVFELIRRMKAKQALYVERPATAPKKQELSLEVEMPLEAEEKTKERVTKTEIVKWAEEAFDVPLRGKVTHIWRKTTEGVYYPEPQVVRMREWGELGVLAHEVAHHLEEVIKKEEKKDWLGEAPPEARQELYRLDYSKRLDLSEGFAEFFRKMVSGVQTGAPSFSAYFSSILKKYSKLERNIAKMKQMYEVWSKQGAEARIAAQIDWSGEHTATTLKEKAAEALKFFQTRFIDEFYTIRKITEAVEKKIGKKLRPSENPYVLATYYKSKAGAVARTFVMEKAIDWTGKVIGPGLKEILEPIPANQMRQFIIYAAALRAQLLEKRGINSGFNPADIDYVIRKYQNPVWDKVAQQITEWSNNLLSWLIHAGSINEKLAQLIRDLNPIYVPFKRVFIDGIRFEVGTGKGVDTGRGVKRIKGSGRPIVNPLESLAVYAREIIARSQKIHIARAFADLAAKYGGLGKYIVRIPAPRTAFKVSVEQVKDAIKSLGKDIPEDVFEDLDGFLTFFTQDWQYNGKEYVVSIWRNGKREFYEIHPELYNALKGVEPLRLDPVIRLFAPFTRLVRLGATSLRVSFSFARNPFRDSLTYLVASKRKHAYVWDPIKHYYKAVKAKPGEATWRFKALGGSVSGQIGFDRASAMRTYDELLLDKLGAKGKVLKVIKHPIGALQDIFSITELGPRSAEITEKYKEYTSPEWLKKHPDWTEEDAFVQAFIDAQDVTVNFSRSGSWGKVLNQIIPFFNSAIQGFDKTYRLFKEQPVKTTVYGLAYLSTLAVWTWIINRDKDWYKNLPPAYKYNNIFVEIGDTVIRLPIPFELGMIFMAGVQAALDTARGDDEAIKGVIDIAKAQLPDVMPAVIRPVFDVLTNKDYLGRPIETEGMQYLYPTERRKSYTSKIAIALSRGLDKIGIKVSPIQIDYLITSYTGGFFRQVKPPTSKKLEGMPVLSDLVLQNKDFPRKQINKFFGDLELLRMKKESNLASNEELRKLKKLERGYLVYRIIQHAIRNAEERKDQEKLNKYYQDMQNLMRKLGYE